MSVVHLFEQQHHEKSGYIHYMINHKFLIHSATCWYARLVVAQMMRIERTNLAKAFHHMKLVGMLKMQQVFTLRVNNIINN